jgi:hypothetical protein
VARAAPPRCLARGGRGREGATLVSR